MLASCRFMIRSVLLIVWLSGGFASSGNIPAGSLLPAAGLQADLDLIWQSLETIHPAPFYATPRPELEQEYRRIRASLHQPLTREAFWVKAAPLISRIHDSHTLLAYPFPPPAGRLLLPADLLRTSAGFLLGRVYRPELQPFAGHSPLAINGRSLDEIARTMKSLMGGETAGIRESAMESDTPKVFWSFLYPDEQQFTFEFPGGMVVTVPGETAARMKEQRPPKIKLAHGIWERRGDCALIRITSLDDDSLKKSWPEALRAIQEPGLASILLDLRGNSGGDTGLAEGIAASLTGKPARFAPAVIVRSSQLFRQKMKERIPRLFRFLPLERLHPRGRAIMEVPEGGLVNIDDRADPALPLGGVRFSGEVRVLIDGNTQSAAAMLAAEIQRHQRGVLLGSEAGAARDGLFGQPLQILLPCTGLTLMVPAMVINRRGEIPAGPEPPLQPDVVLWAGPAARAAGQDPVLDQALAFRPARAGSGSVIGQR